MTTDDYLMCDIFDICGDGSMQSKEQIARIVDLLKENGKVQ
jgi:hypothetical protein